MDITKHSPAEISQTITPPMPSRKTSIQIVFEDSIEDGSKLIEFHSENITQTSYEFERLKAAEVSCCQLAFFGFCCGVLSYDLEHRDMETGESSLETEITLLAGTASTVLLLLAIWQRTHQEMRWLLARGLISLQDDLISSQKVLWLLLEVALNLPHPLYWLRNMQFEHFNHTRDVTIWYTYNSWLSVWMFVRIYHIVKVVSVTSHFRSGRAQRVCRMNGAYPGSWFAMKCLLKEMPYHAVFGMLLCGMLMGAFALRVFERPMVPITNMNYGEFGNAMWNVLVTMTTVGYGDYYPVTLMGRIFGICVCFWGVLSVSMIIITISSLLNLDSSEEKALLILNRLSFKEEMKETAGNLLTAAMRYRSLLKCTAPSSFRLDLQLGKLRRCLHEFQCARNKHKTLYSLDSCSERIEKRVMYVEDCVEGMKKDLEELKEMFAKALGV